MAKVFGLDGEPVSQSAPIINPELLELAEFIRERILIGDVTGLMVVFIKDNYMTERGWGGIDSVPSVVCIGALELFKIQLADLAIHPDQELEVATIPDPTDDNSA